MRRKLVKQGPSTLTVSLPSSWVKANKLLPGNEVLLNIEQNTIVISAEVGEEQEATITVDARGLSATTLGPLLSALHKKGFEEVRFISSKEQFAKIQSVVSKHLLGYEIVQHTPEGVIIRAVTKIDAEELPVLVRRAFLVTLAMAESVQTNNDTDAILVFEETNNRLTNYCERIIVRNQISQKDSIFLYIVVWLLEKIADYLRDIVVSKQTNAEDSELCLQLLKQYYDLFYKYSHKRADEFFVQIKERLAGLQERHSPYVPILLALDQAKASLIALNI